MTLTALLMAGGESRRMGMDKATLSFEGELLWRRQARLLAELGPQALWVSARVRPPWCPPEQEVVLDERPSRGPLSGVASALLRMQTSHLLVLAVDMPRMSIEHLRKITGMARESRGVIPISSDWFEPLCALYPAQADGVAARALVHKDSSMQNFVRMLCKQNLVRTYSVSESEKHVYQNLNSPADLPSQATSSKAHRRTRTVR